MKLPIIIVFNKCDVAPTDNLLSWMNDYEKYMVDLKIYINNLMAYMKI